VLLCQLVDVIGLGCIVSAQGEGRRGDGRLCELVRVDCGFDGVAEGVLVMGLRDGVAEWSITADRLIQIWDVEVESVTGEG
jgi:hypothetical protein